ncbi:Protein CASC3 [Taenia crassiceps]|uniref:Protein CASC3 n=1 Tax=Taenia crassiceps TaxID=6207 RepID=A0ABR4Q158_9CEST
MTKRHGTEKSADDQKKPGPSPSPPPPVEARKPNSLPEMQASGGQVAEQMARCEETGETSFCDGPTVSKDPDEVDAGFAVDSTTPLPAATSQQRGKSALNETGETTFSEDDGDGEVNQVDTESSDDEDLAMRLRRRGGSDSEDEDDYEDEDEDEDRVEAEGEDIEDECDVEEDYYTDDKASQVASEEDVLDSTMEADGTMTTHEKELKEDEVEKEKEKNKHPSSPINRRDPTYVPREGAFYFHDARDESADGDDKVKLASASGIVSTRRSGMLAARWEHDLYRDREQRPRTTEEIVRRYGYDIRKFGLDPTQEVTSRRAVGTPWKRGQVRGQGVRFANSHNDVTAFTTKDFPTLEERDNHENRKQKGGSRFQGAKREENLRQHSEVDDHVATLHIDAGSQDGVQKNHPILRRDRGARGFVPQAGHKEVAIVGEVRNRRGSRGRRFYGTEGDTRRSFNNYTSNRNRDRVVSTVVVAPNSQPLQSQSPLQPPRSGKRYSVNRKTHRPDPPHEVRGVGPKIPTLPDAETRKLYRSVDPSIVAAFVQRHQMENPEAFEAAKAASLSMVEERTLQVVNRTPSPQQCEQNDPIQQDGGTATAKGNA